MTSIKIQAYNPHQEGYAYLSGVISCYQQSFAGPPWNESHVCSNCGQQFGMIEVISLPTPLTCPQAGCGGQLKDFWPTTQVRADFLNETLYDAATSRTPSSWIATDQKRVVGICWGYTITSAALADKVDLPNLAQQLVQRFGIEAEVLAYQDELAVLPEYRSNRFTSLGGKSIARALVEARHTTFQELGMRVGAVRTLEKPATRTFEWYSKVGFEVVAQYPDNPHRVILARSFTGLCY